MPRKGCDGMKRSEWIMYSAIAFSLSIASVSLPISALADQASSSTVSSATTGWTPPSWLIQSGAVKRVSSRTFTSLADLRKWANANHINVIVKDSSGKPIEEVHTDGEDINISYGNGSMTLRDQFGHSKMFSWAGNTGTPVNTTNNSSVASTAATTTSYTLENGSSYYVVGYNMNDLTSNYDFTINYENITQSSMQAEFNALNSVLKNNVEEYTEQNNQTYVDDGWSSNPAALIMADANEYGINPLIILTTLQKEQTLVTRTTAGVGTLAWAMAWGATDNGTIYPNSGFANQITGGTNDLYNLYIGAPTSLPQPKTVNTEPEYYETYEYGQTVEPINAASWALYEYTPWTCEAYPYNGLPQNTYPFGGNLAFKQIYPQMATDF